MTSTTFKFLVLPLAIAAACAAHAQSANPWSVRAGFTTVTPNVSSGDLSAPSLPQTQSAIASSTRLGGGINYALSSNLSIDLPLAMPFKHDISGAGAIAGVGKIAEVKSLPFTLLAQWRFMQPSDKFRPYLGAGLTYAKFYDARSTSTLSALSGGTPSNPTTLSIQSKLAPTVQLGASMALNERWFVDASYTYTLLKARTTLSTGQTQDNTVNPSSLSLAVGYKF